MALPKAQKISCLKDWLEKVKNNEGKFLVGARG
jgi:hypothetical protein